MDADAFKAIIDHWRFEVIVTVAGNVTTYLVNLLNKGIGIHGLQTKDIVVYNWSFSYGNNDVFVLNDI